MNLSWAIDGLLLALGAFVILVALRFLVALARGEDASMALSMTGRWTAGLVGGAFAVGGMGLVELADVVGMLTAFISTHPFAVSNGLVTGLGAFVAGGFLDLSTGQFVGVAIALVGITMLVYEVAD